MQGVHENRAVVLVVDGDADELIELRQLLNEAGYEAIGSGSFGEAMHVLGSRRVDVMITDVRLGAYNGLHLVLTSRVESPWMTAIVISSFPDPPLEREAARYGATAYLVRPLDPRQLLASVEDALRSVGPKRQWPRKKIRNGPVARIAGRDVTLVDVSYGGCRLEVAQVSEAQLPVSFEIMLPTFGLALPADLVWTRRASSGSFLYGVAFARLEAEARHAWQAVVDELPA